MFCIGIHFLHVVQTKGFFFCGELSQPTLWLQSDILLTLLYVAIDKGREGERTKIEKLQDKINCFCSLAVSIPSMYSPMQDILETEFR